MLFPNEEKLSTLRRGFVLASHLHFLSSPPFRSSLSPFCFPSLILIFFTLSFSLLVNSSCPIALSLPLLLTPLIGYLPRVDIFLSQVAISVFPVLNLFPAYVLFCQLFRDLVNICTEKPVGNQPVGVSSLCQLKQTCVCVWETEKLHFNVCIREDLCVGLSQRFWLRVRDEFKVPLGKMERFSSGSKLISIRSCFIEPSRYKQTV